VDRPTASARAAEEEVDVKRTNIETLLGWLEALRRGDHDTVTAALATDVVWQGARDELACHGPEEVATGFAAALGGDLEVQALELIGGEHHAILHVRVSETVEIAGVVFPDGIYNVFTIADHMIKRIDDHTRRTEALTVAGLDTH
jgi:hypothetical protein